MNPRAIIFEIKRRFGIAASGKGFADKTRLFIIIFMQMIKSNSAFQTLPDLVIERVCASLTVCVENSYFTVHDQQGLGIVSFDFEPFMKQHFKPLSGETVVDVGAHVGKYVVLSAKLVGSRGSAVAVEPSAANYVLLQKNIVQNHLSNVVSFPYAAWSRNETLKFYVGRKSAEFSPGRNSEYLEDEAYVEAVSLDHLLLDIVKTERVDWVLIDAEDSDFEVLKGLTKVMQLLKPKIIVEVWNKNVEAAKELFSLHGYSVTEISEKMLFQSGVWCIYWLCEPISIEEAKLTKCIGTETLSLANPPSSDETKDEQMIEVTA